MDFNVLKTIFNTLIQNKHMKIEWHWQMKHKIYIQKKKKNQQKNVWYKNKKNNNRLNEQSIHDMFWFGKEKSDVRHWNTIQRIENGNDVNATTTTMTTWAHREYITGRPVKQDRFFFVFLQFFVLFLFQACSTVARH